MMLLILIVILLLTVAVILKPEPLGRYAGFLAAPLLLLGCYLGLFWAPTERMMGDVQRIMYIHFPSWIAVGLTYTTGFIASALYLFRRQDRFDYWAQAAIEVGVIF